VLKNFPQLQAILLCLFLDACSPHGSDDEPYVEFAGGGFVFNYRIAVVDYGFVVTVKRKLMPGTLLEATFEDPAGGDPIVVTQTARSGQFQYTFRTPPLQGVEADRDYQVTLSLFSPTRDRLLATYRNHYRSNVDQKQMPKAPLTVGPGYHEPR